MKQFIALVALLISVGLVAAAPPTTKAQKKRALLLKQLELERQKPRIKESKPIQPVHGRGVSFFSAQRPWLPPLPFSPLPNKTVYSLGDGKFVYDDTDVDYSVKPVKKASLSFSAAVAPMAAAAGSPSGIRLSLLKTNGGFQLKATNLVPGRAYMLSDKGELKNDFTANWQPSLLFTAVTASVTLTGNFFDDESYYLLWDYDLYSGPVIRITSPSPGSTLSGKAIVTGSVADLLPDRVAELYVDNEFYRDITNGPLRFELDTRGFINGSHQLSVVVRSVFFDRDQEVSSVISAAVNFTNVFNMVNLPPFFSGSPTFDFNTTVPATYQLHVSSSNGTPLRTITGSKPAGPGQVYWDMNNSSGQPMPAGEGYNFRLQTIYQSSQFAAAGPPVFNTNTFVFYSFVEGYLQPGKSFLFYHGRSAIQALREANDKDLLVSMSFWIQDADLFGPDPAGRGVWDDDPTRPFRWTAATSLNSNLLPIIKRNDIGHIFYKGHGSGSSIGTGDDSVVIDPMSVADIMRALGNHYTKQTGEFTLKNSKRYVELNGCNTGTGDWAWAFGIPKLQVDRFPQIQRRSMFAWINTITTWWLLTEYGRFIQDKNLAWHNLDTQFSLVGASLYAVVEGEYFIQPSEFAIYGSRNLTWAVSQF